jgi:GNAT superfamily N-acetyltransferase
MIFREALAADIPQIQFVRHAVKENVLSDPALVTDADCENYLTQRGKGWVCVADNKLVGFAIADLKYHNIWALFVLPEQEHNGIGTTLQQMMLNWYFSQTKEKVWLSTSPGTRAEAFYRKAGWKEKGKYGKGEILFEMTVERWETLSGSKQQHQ